MTISRALRHKHDVSQLPFADLDGRSVQLKDLIGAAAYERDGADLLSRGLYLDLPPWGYHVFELTAL
jgi:hypothetical protein